MNYSRIENLMLLETPETDYSKAYSDIYDIITSHKNYSLEVSALQEFISSRISPVPLKILSVGCGTGTHEILLAKLGHRITGIDISPYMIKQAMAKTPPEIELKFINCDISDHIIRNNIINEYDFCTSLFNVINCLKDSHELTEFFSAINKALKPSATFFFEGWNAALCINSPPKIVERKYETSDNLKKITRIAIPNLNARERKLSILYKIEGEFNGNYINMSSNHHLTLFSMEEIKDALFKSGFELKNVFAALSENLTTKQVAKKRRMISFFAQKISE